MRARSPECPQPLSNLTRCLFFSFRKKRPVPACLHLTCTKALSRDRIGERRHCKRAWRVLWVLVLWGWLVPCAIAAPFYASPVRDGELAIKLHPTEGWGSGTVSTVTFGIPFPRGSILPSELGNIRVLNAQRQEIPAFVEAQTPWRHATDQSKNGTSVRIVRIQFDHAPSVTHPNFETFYVEWGRTARTRNKTTLTDPRGSWHLVTNGSFLAADNVREPNVFAVLPAHWLSRGLLRTGPMDPFDAVVSDARDSPITMDATQRYPGYREQQYAMKNFFYTAINEYGSDKPPTPDRQDPYRSDDEPWLYDRASTFYALYYRSGSFKALREAVRNTEFYRTQLYPAGTVPAEAVGAFKLKNPDPAAYIGSNGTMYSYGEPLAYTLWLTGDNTFVEPIKWVAKVHEDASSEQVIWAPWTCSNDSCGPTAYTERHATFRLMAHVMAYEVFGDSARVIGKTYTYKDRMLEMMANLRWHQDGAGGQIPANRVDGALWKDGAQQQEGGVGTFVAAAWHYGQLIDAVVRVYGLTENPADAHFIRRAGTFLKAATKFGASEYPNFSGQLRKTDYVTNIDGSTYAPDGAFGIHALQVAGALGWSYYFSTLLGVPDSSLKNHANELYTTFDYFASNRVRVDGPPQGFAAFRIGPTDPWRSYNWIHHNSGSLSWALAAAALSPNCRLDVNGDESLSPNVDGVLILRYLLGFRDDALTAGLALTGSRTTAAAIRDFLAAQNLDVRGLAPAAAANAARDGIVILRYLQSQNATAMVAGTDVPGATADAIRARIASWCSP
jgi:hypothetical protein